MDTLYIITPAYNAEKYIDTTIRSVVEQKCGFRIVYHVQDGCSTDGTQEILHAWDEILRNNPQVTFSYSSEPDTGMYDAIQKAVTFLSPPAEAYFTWINADDILCSGALAALEAVAAVTQVDWVYGRVSQIDAGGAVLNEGSALYPQQLVAAGLADGQLWSCMQQEGMFFRKRLWDAAGGANTSLRLAGDWDLWRRMAGHAAPFFYDVPLGRFRMHPDQLTSNPERYFEEIDAVMPFSLRQAAMRRWSFTSFEKVPVICYNGDIQYRGVPIKHRCRCALTSLGMHALVRMTQTGLGCWHKLAHGQKTE